MFVAIFYKNAVLLLLWVTKRSGVWGKPLQTIKKIKILLFFFPPSLCGLRQKNQKVQVLFKFYI